MLTRLCRSAKAENRTGRNLSESHTSALRGEAEEVDNQAKVRPNVSSHSECVLTLISKWNEVQELQSKRHRMAP